MRITEEGWTKKNTNYNLMINTSSRVLDKKMCLTQNMKYDIRIIFEEHFGKPFMHNTGISISYSKPFF